MERYDGKTRKDDYIRYGLIGLGIVIVFVGLMLLTNHLKKTNQKTPDYTIVIGSEEAFGESVQEELERMYSQLVGDLNGDGETLVQLEILRLTDFAAAKADEALAEEAYHNAIAAGEEASLKESFSGLTMDDDFSRLLLLLTTGEGQLFILSDQPRGDFRGAATTYCEAEYFAELPEDLQDKAFNSRCDITEAPFWAELGYEDIPFYACVPEDGDEETFELIRQLKNAHLTMW